MASDGGLKEEEEDMRVAGRERIRVGNRAVRRGADWMLGVFWWACSDQLGGGLARFGSAHNNFTLTAAWCYVCGEIDRCTEYTSGDEVRCLDRIVMKLGKVDTLNNS